MSSKAGMENVLAGKMSRSKGQRGEREALVLLTTWLEEVVPDRCPELKRNLMQSREGGHDLVGIDWLAIEVKRHERLSVESWWGQTLKQAERRPGSVPFLMYRQNRMPWRFRVQTTALHPGPTPDAPCGQSALVCDLSLHHAKLWLQHEYYWREVAQ